MYSRSSRQGTIALLGVVSGSTLLFASGLLVVGLALAGLSLASLASAAPQAADSLFPSSAPASLIAPTSFPVVLPASMPALPPPAPTQAQTLEGVEKYALEHSPLLGIAAARTLEAHANVEVGQASLSPFLLGVGEAMYATGNNSPTGFVPWPDMARVGADNAVPGGGLVDRWHSGFGDGVLAIAGHWLLFDFGAAEERVEAAQKSELAAKDRELATRIAVLASVDDAYLSVLASHEAVEAAQAAIARATQDVRFAEAGLAAGLRAEIDVARARDEIAMAQLTLARTTGQVEQAQENLAAIMGAPPSPLPDATALSTTAPPEGSEAALITQALRTRPDLVALDKDVEATLEAVEATRDERLPAFDATGGLSGRGQLPGEPNSSLAFVNWDVGLVMSVPLYDPTISAQIDQTKAQAAQLEAQRLNLAEQIQDEVVKALIQLRTAIATIEAAKEHESEADATLTLAQGRYSHGFGTWPELTDAEANKIDADLSVIEAGYNEQRAVISLRRALGLLPGTGTETQGATQ